MIDFWRGCGFHLLKRDDQGRLVVTDDFLRAWFLRPELAPVEESCADERALHEALMDNPRLEVPEERVARIADEDARENFRVMLRFRQRLLDAPTLEACYSAVFQDVNVSVPPLFIKQMTQIILRNILDGADDALWARAAEVLFRSQKVNVSGGQIMLADAETIEMHAVDAGLGNIGQLLARTQTPARSIDLDVLDESNGNLYWMRDERYDMVLGLNFSTPGCAALCRVLAAWIRHFHGVGVTISPLRGIEDEHWVWHVGLDAEASGILNDLYLGKDMDEERLKRLLCLFQLEFDDPGAMRTEIAGRPVYLALAMTPDNILRVKPQNLLVNLPLARRA